MSKTTQNEENGVVLTETGFRLIFTIFSTMLSRPKSLRSKLAHWNALVLLLTLLLLEVIVYQAVTYRMVEDLDARLQSQGSKIEAATRQWRFSGTPADLAFFHQLVRGEPVNEFTTNSIYPTFRSLWREKIELTVGRTKQTENLLMERLKAQNLQVFS